MKWDISFFILFIIAIVTCVNDILIYFCHLDYTVSLLIVAFIFLIAIIIAIKKQDLVFAKNFSKYDLIFLIPYGIYCIVKIVMPDYMYDVANYHYYLQENALMNKISPDFLVSGGKVNSFLYPLGDRMHYIFRYLLGVRLGTVLSYFSIVILFYQMKRYLNFFAPKMHEIIKVLVGISPLSLWIFQLFLGTYYIDIFSTVFIMEILYIAVTEKNLFSEKRKLYIWFLLSGISIGIKISNAVLIIPIGVYLVIKNIKEFPKLNWKDYILCIFFFILPFFVYAFQNYQEVGNPFFPFLGGEKYYENLHWQDDKYGIPNFWYSFIWPIVVALNPKKGFDMEIYDYIWAYGYIFLIINILFHIFQKRKNKPLLELEILSFIFTILWANFMMGYTRYALILPVLYTVITMIHINFYLTQYKSIGASIWGVLQAITLVVIVYTGILFPVRLMPSYMRTWKENITYVGKDKNCKIHIDGVWGTINDFGGVISLIREENTPIYNLQIWYIKDSETFQQMYQQNIQNKDIYVLYSEKYRGFDENVLKENGFEVIEKFGEYTSDDIPYITKYDTWTIYKIRYTQK